MKHKILILGFLLFPLLLHAQYEQKIGFDLAAGGFKTFGKEFTEYTGPLQMPNYKTGISANGGIQLKISEHFSLAADFGIMITNGWNYRTPDKDDWLHWSIDDTLTGETVEGEDYLDLHNFSISIKPKYYLLPGKKWDPYLSAGINLNWTRSWFENNLWATQFKRGLLPPEDITPYNDNLEESFGIGFNPALGVEYGPFSMLHLYLETGYYFIALDKNNFKDPSRVENFNAVVFKVGCRLYFIKSKELLK
ncbi:MAG: hypothetical protein NT092_04745 [Bacteroidia bacterium]|nr:hypothetical protein [Bacteroidia bacterium]